jgi:integrase
MAHLIASGRWRSQIRRKELGEHEGVFDTEPEADAWYRKKLAELTGKKAKEAGNGKKLSVVIDEYFETAPFLRKAEGTKRREKSAAHAILNCLVNGSWRPRKWADQLIDLIDAADINNYIAQRMSELTVRGKPVSDDSVRLEVRFLSPIFKHAVRLRYRTTNPALARVSGLDMPRPLPREGRISETQELKLIAAARNHVTRTKRSNACLYPWLKFVLTAACRPGEAAKIELSWVKLEQNVVDIPRRGSKKRNPRRILLTDELAELVAAQYERAKHAKSPYLFYSLNRKTGKLQPYQYSSAWRAIRTIAGVTSEAHGMRREGISRLFERTSLTDGQIALLVGDLNPMSLEPYKNLRAGELRVQMEAFRQAEKVRTDRIEADYVKATLQRLGIRANQLPPDLNQWLDGGAKPTSDDFLELPQSGSDA